MSRTANGIVWVPMVVVVAAFVTLGLLGQLANQAWLQAAIVGGPSASTEIGAVLGGIGAVALLAVTWTARYRDVSLWARAVVALVGVHVAIAAGAWFLSERLSSPDRALPLQAQLPAPPIALGAGLLLFVMAAIHLRVRRLTRAPAWLRGAVVFALAYLLALGIWIPLVAPEDAPSAYYSAARELPDYRVLATLLPPALVALVTAVITLARPGWLASKLSFLAGLLGFAVCMALVARVDASDGGLFFHANYVHVLFAAAWFALCSLAALAWTHARVLRANRADAARPAPWVQRGTVVAAPDRDGAGAWHCDGWLAGLRTSVHGFTLRTARGDTLLVPGGARLVAPVPADTVDAVRGERIDVVHAGDEVMVSGFVVPDGDGPYRAAGLPVPGSDGLVVTASRRPHETIGRDVVLILYRPCVAFVIIAALAALPGLVGH